MNSKVVQAKRPHARASRRLLGRQLALAKPRGIEPNNDVIDHTQPVAVISDIHGNLAALEAVISEIKKLGISRIWCLGDTVGYGANSVECLRIVQSECELVLAGNHDLAVVGDESFSKFNVHSRPALALAQNQLRDATDGANLRDFLATRLSEVADATRSRYFGLEHEALVEQHKSEVRAEQRIVAAHGAPSPYDSIWDYVGVDIDALALTAALDAPPLILVGHHHHQRLEAGVCNPGSVGQPRDGDPRAAWALLPNTLPVRFDTFIEPQLKRTEYDIEKTQFTMRSSGLPTSTIDRLSEGL